MGQLTYDQLSRVATLSSIRWRCLSPDSPDMINPREREIMPELPDVEVFKHYMDATALHQTIKRVEVKRQRILATTPQKLGATITGYAFESTRRHGKYLLVRAGGVWLVMHFGMTGQLKYFKSMEQEPDHDRLLFHFANGYHLAYDCQRLFGAVDVVDTPQQLIEDKELGPDALSLDSEGFRACLEGRRGAIKTALMNQHILAGIGNVYSDEILFQARLHPKTPVSELDSDALRTVFEAMRDVLKTAIDCKADPKQFPASYLIPQREAGAACPGCNGSVKQISFSGRNAYYCPACQRKS
jgi:formamidopyrimidine-DNA glycosylase